MRRPPAQAYFVNPQCITCGMQMRLTALDTNPYDPTRPPIAHFDCDCGEVVTRRWYPVANVPNTKRGGRRQAGARFN